MMGKKARTPLERCGNADFSAYGHNYVSDVVNQQEPVESPLRLAVSCDNAAKTHCYAE